MKVSLETHLKYQTIPAVGEGMIIELFPKGVSKICQDYLGVCPPTKEEDKKSWQVAANRRNNVQTREGEHLTVRPTRKLN